MTDNALEFIDFALDVGALKFGEFTLKSGRQSPYFFNTGLFDSGATLARLGEFYAARATAEDVPEFDIVFGPAYKGIPLVCSVAMALARLHGRDVPYCSNRKEEKDHGEGGSTLGAPLAGRVLIIDDVISAGGSVRESVALIKANGATPAGVLIALDRQERGQGDASAVQQVSVDHGIPVFSIVTLKALISAVGTRPELNEYAEAIQGYRERYGILQTTL